MTANLSRAGALDRHPPAGRRALVVSAQPAGPGASPSNDKEAPLDDHAAEPRSDSGAACRELTARGQARAGLTPLVMVGYGHASLIDCLLPVVARPSRAAKRASRVVTELTATPCDCAADHVEVWVRRV